MKHKDPSNDTMDSFAQSEDDLGIIKERKRITPKSLLRYTILFMMIAVLVASLTTLGVGIYTHEAEYGSRVISGLIGVDMYRVDSLLMISAGSAAILVTALGFFAVCYQHKCLLGLHLVTLAFLSLTIFVAGFLGYIFLAELEDTVKKAMMESVTHSYGVNTDSNSGNRKITKNWDDIQQNFECCGVHGKINSTTSWAVYKESSFWVIDKFANGSLVPTSCCTTKSDHNLCQGLTPSLGPPSVGPPVTGVMVNYTLYTTGCFDKLKSYLEQNGILLGTAAIVCAVFMLVELILSIIFHRSL